MTDPWRRRAQLFGLSFLVFTAYGFFFWSQDLTRKLLWRDPTPGWHFLVSWLVGMYTVALLVPGILALGRRFPIERRVWLRRTALHLGASVVFSLVHLVLDSAVLVHLPILPQIPKTFAATFFVLLVLGFHGNLITYWLVIGLQHGVGVYRRSQEREREALRLSLEAAELQGQLVAAQLSGLKAQLQPHFLFNTLNAIMVLVRQHKSAAAEEMLARLSDLLRHILDEGAVQEVTLARELELVELYLGIEQVRFQDRLRVEIAADPAALDAAVPPLSLQPIVENAVRHGIGRRSAAGRLAVHAARVGERLEIRVVDDGPGPTPEAANGAGQGIGLANTRARLARLYGEAAHLTLAHAPGGGAVATMVLPYRPAPASAGEAVEPCV
jgi:two-component system LytT family sensor kinase